MSMSNASIPVFEVGLNALWALLDKAEAHVEAKRIDPTAILNARLFPDMFAFTRQVHDVRTSRQRICYGAVVVTGCGHTLGYAYCCKRLCHCSAVQRAF
jgi:hypothetical protein